MKPAETDGPRHPLTDEGFREAQERVRHALEAVGVGIWEGELESPRVVWSEITERLHGLAPGTFGGTFDDFVALIHPDDREDVLTTIREGRRNDEDRRFQYRTTLPDGSEHWIECIGRTVRLPGQPARSMGVCMDVTEHRRLQEHVQQAQRIESIGSLAGGVAHDFNNLLTVVAGECEFLAAEIGGDRELRESVDAIRTAAMSAAALTRQLLTFSRHQIARPRHIDVNETLRGFEGVLRRLIEENVRIDVQLAREPAFVRIDPSQLEQVLLNLVVNARDAMPGGGAITIATAREWRDDDRSGVPDSWVVLSVTDTGVGMLPAVRARLFEPFFTTKEHGRGTGLGLVTVHSIVTQAGGGISVSTDEGEGSTFSVWLPEVAEPAQESLGAALPTGEINGTETILVVEDNSSLRRFVERTLKTHGYRPLGAASVAHAIMLWAARGDAIDLVLTDVVMPDRSGPSFAEWVRQQRPGMPVVFMSGYAAASDTARIDVPLLQKPFSSIDLLHAIRDALAPARRDALHEDQT